MYIHISVQNIHAKTHLQARRHNDTIQGDVLKGLRVYWCRQQGAYHPGKGQKCLQANICVPQNAAATRHAGVELSLLYTNKQPSLNFETSCTWTTLYTPITDNCLQ